MMTLDAFKVLLEEELGLDLFQADFDGPLDQIAGWDSVLLLKLVTVVEAETAVSQSLPALLRSTSLDEIHQSIRTT